VTYYLKYRPQKIEELDLALVRQQLKAVLSATHFPHAFLFSGPKGLGKTSAARILAKSLNCEKKAKNEAEPCNHCPSCLAITQGMALDLIEIDAASNRGIDDIRALRQTIKLAPSTFKYKVYIIDEVHMLTPEAFNALLKTLEEPPAHAVFVLATTEPQKLPGTIISRCLQLHFKKPTTEEILRSLKRIVEAEKLKVGTEALTLISRHSGGSFRDAVKILEQLAFGRQEIRVTDVEQFLKGGVEFALFDWLVYVLNQESQLALKMLAEAVEQGVDLKWLVSESLEKLRWLLLIEYGVVNPETEAEIAFLKKIKVPLKEVSKLANLLDEAGRQLKEAVIPQLPLELAIMTWVDFSLSGDEQKIPVPSKPFNHKNQKSVKTTLADIQKNWEKILQTLRPHNSSIEALLRSARPLTLEGRLLTIEAFYPFHKERLEEGKCPLVIEKVLAEIFGEELKIKCVLGERQAERKKEVSEIIKEDLTDIEAIFQ